MKLTAKHLELLTEALPKVKRVAVMNLKSGWDSGFGQAQRAAAASLGLTLLYAEIGPTIGLTPAFELITRERPEAILGSGAGFGYAHRHRIADFAIRNRFPLLGSTRAYVEAGALMSHEPQRAERARIVASFVDRILRGAKPADLPIERATRFELAINLRTAKTLGLTIPPLVLQRADHVIE